MLNTFVINRVWGFTSCCISGDLLAAVGSSGWTANSWGTWTGTLTHACTSGSGSGPMKLRFWVEQAFITSKHPCFHPKTQQTTVHPSFIFTQGVTGAWVQQAMCDRWAIPWSIQCITGTHDTNKTITYSRLETISQLSTSFTCMLLVWSKLE